ncbi:unnamed protein product (macronuclear) [Paramecium tetraurelia]|uniref:Transmembrane protein n=1 Tax=Paramecium tetraurelia TaxID=5888 RepID=A0DV68_PARTE|nr:uncharacterized protein GSPATT00020599001 [Paramecium tetraurelia]CAK86935.1 unnamed protein product [Paramecium tetraurelia]|eukprot:XP_001454332.1 hypothetical protein (macronuclear) [Paramecium tetraurelia strain d4-2]
MSKFSKTRTKIAQNCQNNNKNQVFTKFLFYLALFYNYFRDCMARQIREQRTSKPSSIISDSLKFAIQLIFILILHPSVMQFYQLGLLSQLISSSFFENQQYSSESALSIFSEQKKGPIVYGTKKMSKTITQKKYNLQA